jgi:hypothetical protein
MKTPKEFRVIEQLRRLYKKGEWSFVQDHLDYRSGCWINPYWGKVFSRFRMTAFKDFKKEEFKMLDNDGVFVETVPIVYIADYDGYDFGGDDE